MKLNEQQLRRVVKKLVEDLAAADYMPGEGEGDTVTAPSAVGGSSFTGEKQSKTSKFLDAWRAAGGVWRFSEAQRFYDSLGGHQAHYSDMTISKILEKYGRRVFDADGNKAWKLLDGSVVSNVTPRRPTRRFGR